MTAGLHGSTFGGNPLAMSAAQTVLDVVTAPGFLDQVRHNGLLLKQKLASIQDRFPSVISEVRGEGFLVGIRAVPPAGDLVDALRAENMIVVAAGDNVVRLLPPLIISEAEITEAVSRIERACVKLAAAPKQAMGAAG
jgi:acetylornithine/N-succinyldiaminopimelate aminotransferase